MLAAVRRSYPFPVEMAILGGAVLVWQLARIPFEVGAERAVEAARDLLAFEAALGIDVEGRRGCTRCWCWRS